MAALFPRSLKLARDLAAQVAAGTVSPEKASTMITGLLENENTALSKRVADEIEKIMTHVHIIAEVERSAAGGTKTVN